METTQISFDYSSITVGGPAETPFGSGFVSSSDTDASGTEFKWIELIETGQYCSVDASGKWELDGFPVSA